MNNKVKGLLHIVVAAVLFVEGLFLLAFAGIPGVVCCFVFWIGSFGWAVDGLSYLSKA